MIVIYISNNDSLFVTTFFFFNSNLIQSLSEDVKNVKAFYGKITLTVVFIGENELQKIHNIYKHDRYSRVKIKTLTI